MLMSTGYLAPLTPLVIPGSQSSEFIFNIFLIASKVRERVQINIVFIVVDFVTSQKL